MPTHMRICQTRHLLLRHMLCLKYSPGMLHGADAIYESDSIHPATGHVNDTVVASLICLRWHTDNTNRYSQCVVRYPATNGEAIN